MKLFPVMGRKLGDPKLYVPWELVEPARAQAMHNHDQTLERLAERGGLDPVELYGALHRKNWTDLHYLDYDACLGWVKEQLKQYQGRTPA